MTLHAVTIPPLDHVAMSLWSWACGLESDADAGPELAMLRMHHRIPGPRWRQRMRLAGVPRLVIRALARRFQGKPAPYSP